jgi:hypothetical protein
MKKKDPSKVTVLQLLERMMFNAKSKGYIGFLCIDAKHTFEDMTGVKYAYQSSTHASCQLVEWIHRQLEGRYTYESWLRVNHPEARRAMERDMNTAFSDGRILWIQAMIEQLKSEAK